ncbi:hypothetical protein GCM10009430_29470 [Aquimarina litoralis]|uniref:Lipoprotein n=1 Tax=Aquimarina litoralis TaxID=584605 RepID=A0ABN1J032_9FLAO
MKFLIIPFALTLLISCTDKTKILENQNLELTNQVKQLQQQIDSLKNLPSIHFEKIITKDISLDSLRNESIAKYISPLKNNLLKTKDSAIITSYLNFAKRFPNSYFSMYAIDRIKTIKEKRKTIKINELVGSWKWETRTNTLFPLEIKRKEQIVFEKDKTVKFFKNGELTSKEKYHPITRDYLNQYITFSKKGTYNIFLLEGDLLKLTKGKGTCFDCGSDIYKKVK